MHDDNRLKMVWQKWIGSYLSINTLVRWITTAATTPTNIIKNKPQNKFGIFYFGVYKEIDALYSNMKHQTCLNNLKKNSYRKILVHQYEW